MNPKMCILEERGDIECENEIYGSSISRLHSEAADETVFNVLSRGNDQKDTHREEILGWE